MPDPKDATIQQLRERISELEAETAQYGRMRQGYMDKRNAEVEKLREALTSVSYRAELFKAERDVALGMDCLVDGDGPCGVCVKCFRLRAEKAEAALTQAEQERDKAVDNLNKQAFDTEDCRRERIILRREVEQLEARLMRSGDCAR